MADLAKNHSTLGFMSNAKGFMSSRVSVAAWVIPKSWQVDSPLLDTGCAFHQAIWVFAAQETATAG
jgi:hypothetical protein